MLPKYTECAPNQAEVGEAENNPNRIDDATALNVRVPFGREI